jgi:hypothetical protein
VLDLHQLPRRAATESKGEKSDQNTYAAPNQALSREGGREGESTNLKVVREKEYWLSPMAEARDYLVGFFGLLEEIGWGERGGC